MSCEEERRSPGLEAVIQKLEESLLHPEDISGERSLTVQVDEGEAGGTAIPIFTRIRQIITSNLAGGEEALAGASSEICEMEESRTVGEQPSSSQLDQLPIKCSGDKQRVHLESAERQKRLEQDLNIEIQKRSSQLQEEQMRCASLSQVNSMLREQLDQAGALNRELAESLWTAQEELVLCETRLQREQKTAVSRSDREQAGIRAVWRLAASLRSEFTQFRTFTDRTLSGMLGECAAVSRHLRAACTGLDARLAEEHVCSRVTALETQLREKLKEAMQLQAGWDAQKVQLNSRIQEMTDAVKHLQSQSSEKDAGLSGTQAPGDGWTRGAEEGLLTEIHNLHKILSHIHQLVSSHGDSSGSKTASASPLCTLEAVQKTLSKHQAESQELHTRLEAAQVQVDTLRDQLLEEGVEQMISRVQSGGQEVKDDSMSHCCALEPISNQENLEELLSGLRREVRSQSVELEAQRRSTLDLQRQRDLLRQQREELETQLAQQRTEAQRGEKSLQELDRKHSDLRRELFLIKEAFSQITLQKELLENDKAGLSEALTKMESQLAAKDCALAKLQNQEADLKDTVVKMAALSEGLAKDKVALSRIVMQTEGEKGELDERRREAVAERTTARERAARAQKEMTNLLAEKQVLESSHGHLQDLCQKLEAEQDLLLEEKAGALKMHSQVKRQMQALQEELGSCRKELEEKTAAVKRVTQDREEQAKDKAALEVRLNSAERKACVLTQGLADLRAERESLEKALFESQELSASLEAEVTRLEGRRNSLILANEALTRDAAQRRGDAERELAEAAQQKSQLEEKLAQVARNALLVLSNKEQIHREQMETERMQREQQCSELAALQDQAEEQLHRQCEELRMSSQRELQQVQEELARTQKEFSQSLLQAESEKQQALSLMEAERAALTERMESLQKDVTRADLEIEHIRRDAVSKQEQDKSSITALQLQLQDLQTQLERSLDSHQQAHKSFTEQVKELNEEKEHAQQELRTLQLRLQEAEESLAKGHRDLTEAHREIGDSAQEQNNLRKEALDLRRHLNDETSMREAIRAANHQLRALIKKAERDKSSLKQALEQQEQKWIVLEECKNSVQQEAATLRSSMRELEKTHLQSCRELQELRRQVKMLEGENSRQTVELLKVQARVCHEEQKEEEARQEAFTLQQRLLECEAVKEAALNEVAGLQRCVRELETAEERSRRLQQDLQQTEQRYKEAAAQLEASRTQIEELSVLLGLCENKAQGLEEQLVLSDAKYKEVEHRLAELLSALRCTISVNHGSRSCSPSPWKRQLHVKGGESEAEGSFPSSSEEELSVKNVKNALQGLLQELRDAQREKDETKAQVVVLSQEVKELKDSHEVLTTQLLQLQRSVKQSEKGQEEMAEQLVRAHTSLSLQQDLADRSEKDKRALEAELAQLKGRLEVLQGLESSANAEVRKHKESLEAAESRASSLEVSQHTLEGEMQRAQLRAAELEAEAAALQERLTDTRRKLSESEDRCAALQVNEQRQAAVLARAEQQESQLREKTHKLSNSLNDLSRRSEGLQEQMTELQRALVSSEQDRRLLQERLDKTWDALSESQRLKHALTEERQSLQKAQEDSELKISELENNNRVLKESLKQQQDAELCTSHQLHNEKDQLKEKLRLLQTSMQKLQQEKAEMEPILTRLSKDKSVLRKTLEKVEMDRLRKQEEAASAARDRAQLEQRVHSMEQQLAEKQDALQTLQSQVSHLEHSHAQRFLEVTAYHHKELEEERARLKDSQLRAEFALDSREAAHQQRVRCLEEQVLALREQLDQESRRRQAYFNQMLQPGRQ
ncbi:ciliary rootlet coiled-coil protein 2 isoform X1 [Oryzias latipes]